MNFLKINAQTLRAVFNRVEAHNNLLKVGNYKFEIVFNNHTLTTHVCFVYKNNKQIAAFDRGTWQGQSWYTRGYINEKNNESVLDAIEQVKKVKIPKK